MPGDVPGPGGPVEVIEEIPLYLIPKTIADQIRSKRDTILRILIERRFRHRYIVKIEILGQESRRENCRDPDTGERKG